MIAESDIQRFANLFAGFSKAYGTTRLLGKTDERGKQEVVSKTVRGTVSLDHYAAHLQGDTGLGIVVLRDDDTVCFAAIDYDVYTSDIEKAEKAINEKGLPLVPMRSKSGGIHLYCFLAQPTSARLVLERLAEWSAML